MNGLFRAGSISAKLTWLNLLVTGAALSLACLSFLANDFFSYRQNLIQNLYAVAQIAGSDSVSALLFDDPQSAENTLDGLKGTPDVIAAALLTEDGHVFAQYRRPDTKAGIALHFMDPTWAKAQWTNGSEVLVAYRIMHSGKSLGVIYVQAHLSELRYRLQHYGFTAFMILLFCMTAALLATATFRRLVTRPITALANTARKISREKDFSVRAQSAAQHDEIAVLVDAFNEMLQQIQTRDEALREGRALLERRVQERTAELRAANRELEAFSYSVAHDLRGPLDVISGMSYVMQHNYQDKLEPAATEMLDTVQRTARSMANLIDDLLNLARATTVGLDRKEIDLTAMARSIAEDIVSTDPDREVKFTIAENAKVNADRGLMKVVMENLIRNAWKYTSGHSKALIEFGATAENGHSIFYVRDDGAGFDQQKADGLFAPFQRLHTSSEFPGTGIGLATVERIIARHGGKVWAEGAVERGATFYFTL